MFRLLCFSRSFICITENNILREKGTWRPGNSSSVLTNFHRHKLIYWLEPPTSIYMSFTITLPQYGGFHQGGIQKDGAEKQT